MDEIVGPFIVSREIGSRGTFEDEVASVRPKQELDKVARRGSKGSHSSEGERRPEMVAEQRSRDERQIIFIYVMSNLNLLFRFHLASSGEDFLKGRHHLNNNKKMG